MTMTNESFVITLSIFPWMKSFFKGFFFFPRIHGWYIVFSACVSGNAFLLSSQVKDILSRLEILEDLTLIPINCYYFSGSMYICKSTEKIPKECIPSFQW